ncbi:MOB kinase activator-like 2 [Haematobia irritans]|uniref:MOB kinase activator-like 2 n=1 Tax=Haematobia irritans TaxID=7368 RepID=UPI003F5054A0
MNWAISNLTGSNRVSRAILVRYSQVPLADAESTPQTPSSSSSSKSHDSAASSFASTFLHPSRHVPGRAVPRGNNNNNNNNNHHPHHSHHQHHHATATAASNVAASAQLSLPLDVEETVTCFCR